jgi:uncharacterized protein YdhG (YjbR/CyaY superfamily)
VPSAECRVPTPDPAVDAYLATVDDARRPAVTLLRDLCLEHLDGFTEGIRYGMPAYWREGVDTGGVAFAAQKQYLSFYVTRTDVVAAHRDRLAGLSVGKGCIRYRRPDQLDAGVVRSILAMTASTEAPGC